MNFPRKFRVILRPGVSSLAWSFGGLTHFEACWEGKLEETSFKDVKKAF